MFEFGAAMASGMYSGTKGRAWAEVYINAMGELQYLCMSETLNYSLEEWVRFLTESVQYLTFNSFLYDL